MLLNWIWLGFVPAAVIADRFWTEDEWQSWCSIYRQPDNNFMAPECIDFRNGKPFKPGD